MRRIRLGGAVTAALVLASTLAASAPVGAGHAIPPRPIRWLMAGDSYAAGFGIDYHSGCATSDAAWPRVAERQMRTAGWTIQKPDFVACSGHTATELLGEQLSRASHSYDLVTLSIGGNDSGFSTAMLVCIGTSLAEKLPPGRLFSWLTTRVTGCPPDRLVRDTIDAVGGFYTGMLIDLTNRKVGEQYVVNHGAHIVVVGYPSIFEQYDRWNWTAKEIGLCQGIDRDGTDRIRGWAGHLNSTIGSAVQRANALRPRDVTFSFVNVQDGVGNNPGHGSASSVTQRPNLFEPMGSNDRHNLCGGSSWMFGAIGGRLHPNRLGHVNMAATVSDVLSNLDWSKLGSSGGVPVTPPAGAPRAVPVPAPAVPPAPPSKSPAPTAAPSPPPGPAPTQPPATKPPAPAKAPAAISLAKGGSAPHGYWYSVSLSGFGPGSSVTVTCRDSVDPGGFHTQTFTIDGGGNAGDSTLCYSADGPDHWVTGGGVESNHVSWGGSTSSPPSQAPPPPARINLARGGSAPHGYWYSVSLSGFGPGSSVTVTCRDSVDPGGFYTQTFTIDGGGNAGDSTLCYSADGPDHWVTGGGVESNHVSW